MQRPSGSQRLVIAIVVDTLLPLTFAALTIALLTDALVNRLDPAELRLNTLLMGTRPFRVLTDGETFVVSVASSVVLVTVAVAGAALVGVVGGVTYAWSRHRRMRALLWTIATIGSSLPTFFWAVAFEVAVFAVYLRTGVRILPQAGFGLDEHLVLPALALAARPTAYILRLTAGAVEQARNEDYVRTARGKGLSELEILRVHVLPNAAPAILAAVVLGARSALSSVVIVEFVYVWGGAGLTFVQAVGARQAVLAGALALTFAFASSLLALAAELAQRRLRSTT